MRSSRPDPKSDTAPSVLPSPEELMAQYALLVWKTAATYLRDPEDIKECVNDTFLAFYMQIENFTPAKRSYASLLVSIARNKAVDRYRKNRASGSDAHSGAFSGKTAGSFPAAGSTEAFDIERIPDPENLEDRIITETDLKAALDTLSPEEFDLIRMKYYNGMSIREIAESMDLPYETVKKRHQRSLFKLRRFLTTALIILLIAAVLTACAYIILRYFGIVPGYGVNLDIENKIFVLNEPVSSDNGQYHITINRALLSNGTFGAEITVHNNTPGAPFPENSYEAGNAEPQQPIIAEIISIDGESGNEAAEYVPPWYSPVDYWFLKGEPENTGAHIQSLGYAADEDTQVMQMIWFLDEMPGTAASGEPDSVENDSGEPDSNGEDTEEHEFILVSENSFFEIPIRLTPIQELPLEQYSYELTELGGFMTDAYIEDGHLMADVYALPGETFVPASYDEITAVSEDGSRLTGSPAGNGGLIGTGLSSWDFGPAEPGSYTIELSSILISADMPEDASISLSRILDPEEDHTLEIPGGTAEFGTPTDEHPLPEARDSYLNEGTVRLYFPVEVTPYREDLSCYMLTFGIGLTDAPDELLYPSSTGMITDPNYEEWRFWGLEYSWPEDVSTDDLSLLSNKYQSASVIYSWDYTFSIETEAEERTEDPEETEN